MIRNRQSSLWEPNESTLIAEVEPVFSYLDNKNLAKLPDKVAVKEILFNLNLDAAPGTDGITSLLYKEHWDLLGDYIFEVVTAVHKGEMLTRS
jgi:hypothetical protein